MVLNTSETSVNLYDTTRPNFPEETRILSERYLEVWS